MNNQPKEGKMEKEQILKHIVWQYGATKGKVAVFFDEEDGYLEIKPIKGSHPPIGLTFAILDVTLHGKWRKEAVKFFHHNEKPWRVDVRQGRSGCRTFMMRRLENERLLVVSTTATVHISMFQKFRVIKGYLGELAPILERILELYSIASVKEIEPSIWEGLLEGESVTLKIARLPKDDFHHPLVKLYLEVEEDKEEDKPEIEIA
jgi:hypothetical protein